MRRAALILAAVGSLLAGGAAAQDDAGENAIVVTAQRSGAPIWTIDTAGGTIILVGEIRNVPKSTPWQPDRLEEVTAQSSRVILGTKPKVSPGDILRLIFRGGRFTKLPDGTQASDYLDAEQMARLSALEVQYDEDYSGKSFLMTAFDLMTRRLRFNRDTGKDASEVVERAARRADVPAQPVGTMRGEDILDNLAEAEPATHLPCLDAAMSAAEIGPQIVEKRGDDWRSFDVPAVMANPLELALGQCWPWADEEMGGELRGQWVEAIARTLEDDGVTLAVVPLRVLAEEEGVLDQLTARGLEISGPAWK